MRGRGVGGGMGRGQVGHAKFGEGIKEQGHAEVMWGVNMGIGDGDVEEREWVCDSGADYHM